MKTQRNSQCIAVRTRYNNHWRWTVVKIPGKAIFSAALPLVLCVTLARATVYVTADNGTNNLFGTLDLATGQFSQIATTTPLFFALSTGPGGHLFGADINSGNLYTISPSGVTMQYGSVTAPSGFFGLAYSFSAGNFFADNLDPTNVTLYSIAADGNSSSPIGVMAGPNSGFFPTGNLAFGPGGKLYFDFFPTSGASSQLYTVNVSTGTLTPVGSGLGTDILNLFSNGSTLYGIDTDTTSNIGIYTINTTTGVATQISTVTGLPLSNDYFVDTSASTSDTGSTFALFFLALAGLIGASRLRRAPLMSR